MKMKILIDHPNAEVRKTGFRLPPVDTMAFAVLLLALNWPLIHGVVPRGFVLAPDSVQAGEWWRLLTHPFVHVSWYHLLLDAGAFLLLHATLREGSPVRRLGYVASSGMGSLILSWPFIQGGSLCGLSGVAHGLMAVVSLEMMTDVTGTDAGSRKVGLITFLIVAGKSGWEAITGQALIHALHFGLMGHPVVMSHAGGVLGGALAFFLGRRVRSVGTSLHAESSDPGEILSA